uniref:Reverse transcriptase domain-containing protein n=1 Tax=Tanacetum cinerariifolium TaxID=118510 RepID=A0A6L2P1F6_TANCI|nr:hypothetical protein [Tanacetum cinerariifolium]
MSLKTYSHAGAWSWGQYRGEANAFYFSYSQKSGELVAVLQRIFISLGVQKFTSKNWRHPWYPNLIYHSSKMTSPAEGRGPEGQDHREKNKADLIQLDFEEEDTEARNNCIVKGKEVVDNDLNTLQRSFENTSYPHNHRLCRPARGWFERLPAKSINEWSYIREAFSARKVDSRNWVYHMGVSEVMKISSFMYSLKCPELAKRFSNKSPTTVNEMMRRLDDFVRSEKAFAKTKLLKGKTGEQHRKSYFPLGRKDDRPYRNSYMGDPKKYDNQNQNKGRDNHTLYKEGDYQPRIAQVLTLDSLTKPPKEILATETQLRLLSPRPMLNPQKSGNMDRYCI